MSDLLVNDVKVFVILKIRIGSHLYGTNTPASDEDYAGIFIPSPQHLLGLKRVEEIDLGTKVKDDSGKNTQDAIDFKLYSLQKFIRLALDNNPNILEMLFVNEENILEIEEEGKQLLDLRQHFLSKNIKHRFLGYAISQKKKMVIKLENYEKLTEAYEFLSKCNEKFLLDINNDLFKRKIDHFKVADINIPATVTIKKAKSVIKNRLDKFGSRKLLVSKYGYDTKFAMHLLRLLYEGLELLETGDLTFPLQQRKMLLAIREGKYTLDDILKMSAELESNIDVLYNSTSLPSKPNREKIEKWLINTQLKYVVERRI